MAGRAASACALALAPWLVEAFGLEAVEHLAELDLLSASDDEIFEAARRAGVVVTTKDRDFVDLLDRRGQPPQLL